MKAIGKNIRQIRTNKAMSQEELADALFVTRQTVSNYETGRSQPDVDTLMRIADILETDIHVLIYGPPVTEDKKSLRKRLIISGILLVLAVVAYSILFPILKDMAQKKFIVTPLLLLRITIRPVLLFAAGRFLMNMIAVISGLKQKESKVIKVLRISVLTILGLLIILPLPYMIWACVGLYRSLTMSSVSMVFPNIPVYTPITYGIMWLHLECPFFMSVLGMILPLKAFPNRKK